jgi:hypothetical protein
VKTGKPDASSWAREVSVEDRRSFGDLARRLAGRAPAMLWWAQSHDRVIRSFPDEPVPERPVDIETRVCAAVGDEFYARLNSGDTGLAPASGCAPSSRRPGPGCRRRSRPGRTTGDRWRRSCGAWRASRRNMRPAPTSRTSSSPGRPPLRASPRRRSRSRMAAFRPPPSPLRTRGWLGARRGPGGPGRLRQPVPPRRPVQQPRGSGGGRSLVRVGCCRGSAWRTRGPWPATASSAPGACASPYRHPHRPRVVRDSSRALPSPTGCAPRVNNRCPRPGRRAVRRTRTRGGGTARIHLTSP